MLGGSLRRFLSFSSSFPPLFFFFKGGWRPINSLGNNAGEHNESVVPIKCIDGQLGSGRLIDFALTSGRPAGPWHAYRLMSPFTCKFKEIMRSSPRKFTQKRRRHPQYGGGSSRRDGRSWKVIVYIFFFCTGGELRVRQEFWCAISGQTQILRVFFKKIIIIHSLYPENRVVVGGGEGGKKEEITASSVSSAGHFNGARRSRTHKKNSSLHLFPITYLRARG